MGRQAALLAGAAGTGGAERVVRLRTARAVLRNNWLCRALLGTTAARFAGAPRDPEGRTGKTRTAWAALAVATVLTGISGAKELVWVIKASSGAML
jgi:hypothetical protein